MMKRERLHERCEEMKRRNRYGRPLSERQLEILHKRFVRAYIQVWAKNKRGQQRDNAIRHGWQIVTLRVPKGLSRQEAEDAMFEVMHELGLLGR